METGKINFSFSSFYFLITTALFLLYSFTWTLMSQQNSNINGRPNQEKAIGKLLPLSPPWSVLHFLSRTNTVLVCLQQENKVIRRSFNSSSLPITSCHFTTQCDLFSWNWQIICFYSLEGNGNFTFKKGTKNAFNLIALLVNKQGLCWRNYRKHKESSL